MTTSPIEWCGASTRRYGPMPLGPCVLRHGHDGPLHRDEAGVSWTDPRPASESSEPLCGSALRDRLAKALRGKHDSTDSRPSYRAADALVPVVEAWAAEQTAELRARILEYERERDEARAALRRSRDALAAFDGRGVITLEGANLDIPTPAEIRDAWRASLDPPEGT